MKNLIFISCFVLLVISCTPAEKPLVRKIYLNDNWEFSEVDNDEWHPAIVPGTVHTDLFNNGKIPDPFYGCNEEEIQWVGRHDWVYRTNFHVDNELLAHSNIELILEGLDTYAEVFLNNRKILKANNMFRTWEVDCKEFLQPGVNLLEIKFYSPENRFIEDSLALSYPLPGGRWVFARKPAYHFGWDWGPTLITSGIWKPVYLKLWNNHLPKDIRIVTREVNDEYAAILTTLNVVSEIPEDAVMHITDNNSGKIFISEKLFLKPGQNEYDIEFNITNPELWWSNGLGDPHLYELNFELVTSSGYRFEKHIPYGIRTIEVVTEDDEYGESFYIKLNGVPVYMKGANYIPQHSFVTEVGDEDYRNIIHMAVESNMNMLRVWGGGIYEKDIFYELCDRNGILVWQDFMFACAMYPGDDDFIGNVTSEAIEQVIRLRNRASLALWCGNNEVDEGWHNWGWQRQHNISPEDSATIWEGYKRVFHELLPEIVNTHDTGRFYLPTSPLHGWGHEESLTEGSAHYWGVWWGMQPFEKYLEKVPRFMSEFGFQAMPALAAIREFQTPDDDYLFSSPLLCHQKHPTGYETISAYLARENLYPETLQEYIYLSQLIQAKGIGLAIEAQRRSMPRCMGTLYWQFNDCWPVVSWSGIDAFGNWKALQYTVRELYDDIMVSVTDHNNITEVYVVSDRLEEIRGRLEINLHSFPGEKVSLHREEIVIPANSSQKVFSESSIELFADVDLSEYLIEATFITDDGQRYSNQKYLLPFGNLQLPEVKVNFAIEPASDGYYITLSTDAFAAYVQLYLKESHAWFDKNYFHLWPGENITVFCRTDLSPESFSRQLQVYHLANYTQKIKN